MRISRKSWAENYDKIVCWESGRRGTSELDSAMSVLHEISISSALSGVFCGSPKKILTHLLKEINMKGETLTRH